MFKNIQSLLIPVISAMLFFASCSKEEKVLDTSAEKTETKEMMTEVSEKATEVSEKVTEKVSEVTEAVSEKVTEGVSKVESTVKNITDTVKEKVSGDSAEAAKVEEVKGEASIVSKAVETMKAANLEVACGKCVFKVEECKECKLYVKMGDGHYPVMGLDVKPETLGLCKTSANADMVGKLVDGNFMATAFENLKVNLPEIKDAGDAVDQLKKIKF